MGILKGKICWIDHVFDGADIDKDVMILNEDIIDVIIDKEAGLIKFNLEDLYNVNLINEVGNIYQGKFKDRNTSANCEASCELFENNKKYMLFGKWKEEGEDEDYHFSWWATINK